MSYIAAGEVVNVDVPPEPLFQPGKMVKIAMTNPLVQPSRSGTKVGRQRGGYDPQGIRRSSGQPALPFAGRSNSLAVNATCIMERKRQVAKAPVFISFDYDHDSFLREAIVGQSKLEDSPFEHADWSIKEHLDGDWKVKATIKIRSVDLVVVLCGEHTNTAVGVSAELKIAQAVGKPYFLFVG